MGIWLAFMDNPGNLTHAVNGGTPMHEESDFDLSYLTLSSTYKDLEQLFLKMQLLGCALLPFVVT